MFWTWFGAGVCITSVFVFRIPLLTIVEPSVPFLALLFFFLESLNCRRTWSYTSEIFLSERSYSIAEKLPSQKEWKEESPSILRSLDVLELKALTFCNITSFHKHTGVSKCLQNLGSRYNALRVLRTSVSTQLLWPCEGAAFRVLLGCLETCPSSCTNWLN